MIFYSSELEKIPVLNFDFLLFITLLYIIMLLITKRYSGFFQRRFLIVLYPLFFLGGITDGISDYALKSKIFNAVNNNEFYSVSGEINNYESKYRAFDSFSLGGEYFGIYAYNAKKSYYTGLKKEGGVIENGKKLEIRYVSSFGSNYIVRIYEM